MIGILSSTDLTKAFITSTCSSCVRKVLSPAWPRATSPLDAVNATKLGAQTLDCGIVDRVIEIERGYGRQDKTCKVDLRGGSYLLYVPYI